MARTEVLLVHLLMLGTACGGSRGQPLEVEAVDEEEDGHERRAAQRSGASSAQPSDGEWGPVESHSMGRGGAGPSGRVECASNEDCVPATCCHATSCLPADRASSCADVSCTADCQYGTLDCGGACLCYDGRCQARLSQPPAVGEGGTDP